MNRNTANVMATGGQSSNRNPRKYAPWTGAHYVYTEDAGGSNPSPPTNKIRRFCKIFEVLPCESGPLNADYRFVPFLIFMSMMFALGRSDSTSGLA